MQQLLKHQRKGQAARQGTVITVQLPPQTRGYQLRTSLKSSKSFSLLRWGTSCRLGKRWQQHSPSK